VHSSGDTVIDLVASLAETCVLSPAYDATTASGVVASGSVKLLLATPEPFVVALPTVGPPTLNDTEAPLIGVPLVVSVKVADSVTASEYSPVVAPV